MALDVQRTALDGVLVITPKKFGDDRGFFSETYNAKAMAEQGVTTRFCQDNHSFSATPGTLRGLHFQKSPTAQTKLVRVTRGSVLDVAVDIRTGSPTYGRHVAVELSAENWTQILVPAGFAHGFCTLVPDTEVLYKVDAPYSPDDEGGLLWSDPALGIPWPEFAGSVTSGRDEAWPLLTELQSPFLWSV